MILTAQFVPLAFGLILIGTFFLLVRVSTSQAFRARAAADRRAEVLMAEILGPDAYRQVVRKGFLDVPSPSRSGRIYRVPRSRDQVRVYEDGRLVERLCIQSIEPMPYGDIIVMHKLMIEADEEEYLRIANHFS
jgi:hypothetical protein